MTNNANLPALLLPPRVPRLKYRNPRPSNPNSPISPSFPSPLSPTSPLAPLTPLTPNTPLSPLPPYLLERPFTSDSEASLPHSRRSSEASSLMSASQVSVASSRSSTEEAPASRKKKTSNVVLGFFSLKEPSQVALEKYAQQQRKQAALKAASTSSSTHRITPASKPLPLTVPKVNAKWNGAPSPTKPQRSPSPKVSKFSQPSKDATRVQPNVQPPVLSKPCDFTNFAQEGHAKYRPISPASSTGSVDTIVRDTAQAILNKLNDQPKRSSFNGRDALAVQTLHQDELDDIPDSHDFLFAPPAAEETPRVDSPMASMLATDEAAVQPAKNFSRPIGSNDAALSPRRLSTFQSVSSESTLPTLYETSLASTESLVTIKDDSDAHSIIASSIAPSELSVSWSNSPRERLGLGGRLRLQDDLPWNDFDSLPVKPKKNRLSMFGLGVARA